MGRRFLSLVILYGHLLSAHSSKQMSAPGSPIMAYNAHSAPGAPSRMRGQAFDYVAFSPVRQPDFFEQGFVPNAPRRVGGVPLDHEALSPIRQPDFFGQDQDAPGAPLRISTPPQISDSPRGVKRKLFPAENQDGSVTPPAKKPCKSPPSLPRRR